MKRIRVRSIGPARRKPLRRFPLSRFFILACIAILPARAFAVNPLALDVTIQGITQAQPPMLVGDVAIFTYKPEERATRFVGARFAHENYTILHTYSRNENGVFVLDYELPEGLREIRYRIDVDGLWMSDPSNPLRDLDALGNAISVFTIAQEPSRTIANPKIETDGRLTFVYSGQAGQRISIAGDFNDWDPFIDFFTEVSPGTYRITIRVMPGAHFYYFFSLGRRILDPFDPETAVGPDGNTVSYFVLPS